MSKARSLGAADAMSGGEAFVGGYSGLGFEVMATNSWICVVLA